MLQASLVPMNELTNVNATALANGITLSFDIDAIGRPTAVQNGNGVVGSSTWDAASRLGGLNYATGGTAFVDRTFTRDLHGNMASMTIDAGILPQIAPQMKRLQQNPADELTVIQTKINPGVQDWNNATPTHDLEGNLTSDGTQTYTYDYENRLVLCDSASLRETFFYSADGSRVAAEAVSGASTNLTIFVLDHGDPLRRPVAELDAYGQPLRYFVWGNGLVAQIEAGSGVVRYFHPDGQGSTLALTDASAAVTDQWFHDPYGETMNRTGTTDTPYEWIGGHGVRAEATGLHFMRHRYYHAGLKRFTVTDPLGVQELLGRGGLANLYQYANNSPLAYVDPDGLWTFGFGLSVSGNWFGFGGSAGFQVALSDERGSGVFSGWNVGLVGQYGGGIVGAAPGGSVTFDVSHSLNPDIESLSGWGTEGGGSGTYMGVTAGASVTRDIHGVNAPLTTLSLGAGGPAPVAGEAHGYGMRTGVLSVGDFRSPRK